MDREIGAEDQAIDEAQRQRAEERRGDPAVPELTAGQIAGQLRGAVDRVMMEAGLWDPELAALAIKQAGGDLTEAVILLRGFRVTLPRFGVSEPLNTAAMITRRRISPAIRDPQGGQVLGPTSDFSLRLLNSEEGDAWPATPPGSLNPEDTAAAHRPGADDDLVEPLPGALDPLAAERHIEPPDSGSGSIPPRDPTREPAEFPANRQARLQKLALGDEGFLLALAASAGHGEDGCAPFVGEIRMGDVVVGFTPGELGFAIEIGEITVTEATILEPPPRSSGDPPRFARGYGLAFGHSERKALGAALVDLALRRRDPGRAKPDPGAAGGRAQPPAEDEEFVLRHCDGVETAGHADQLKQPHYQAFAAEVERLHRRREAAALRAREPGG